MVRCLERYAGILLGDVAFAALCFICGSMATAIALWGASLDKVAHTTWSCPSRASRVAAMVSWHDLLGAICVPSAGLTYDFAFFVLTLGLRSRNGFSAY